MEQPPHNEMHPRAFWGLRRYFWRDMGKSDLDDMSREDVIRILQRDPSIEERLLAVNGIGEKILGEIMNWAWEQKPVSSLHIRTKRKRYKWQVFGRKIELIITKK